MIWILLVLTVLVALFVLFGPLFKSASSGKSKTVLVAISGISAIAIIGIYALNGRPELTGDAPVVEAPNPETASTVPTESPDQLVAQLKNRLTSTDSRDPDGWWLLARSQMNIQQFDDALISYETLIEIAPDNAQAIAEYESAQKFIQRQEMMQQAQSMTPEDQQAMINTMIEGLAARIYENGGTPEEWIRLLRARKVQGQDELLADDIALMKKQFEDRPDVIKRVLSE